MRNGSVGVTPDKPWRWRFWMAVAVAMGVVLTRLPLFGVLGFEHATVVAVFASLVGLDLGSAFARKQTGSGLISLLTRTLARVLVVVAVPGVIAAIHGAWAPTCDWLFGLQTYGAMPIASAVVATAAGIAIGTFTGPRRRVLGNVLPYVLFILVAFSGLWRFYAAPPVFSFNPIVGYFPGNLYDEDIRLTLPLLWSRLEQLAAVIAMLALCNVRFGDAKKRAGVVVALAIATVIALRYNAGALGYAIDAEDIADALGGRLETAHFIIHYAKSPEIERDIALIAEDHEFRYSQVTAILGATLPTKINSYYFADSGQKARWMGARDVEMAKPWRREIYLDHRAFPHSSLRHEIAHIVAGAFGDPWFAVSARRILGLPVLVNPGLVEGLAVAADWPGGYDRGLTPDESVAAMQAQGVTPSIDTLLSLGFLSTSSARSYTTAGSFVHFLLTKYGAPSLRELYRSGGDFAGAYHKSQHELGDEWRAYIATITLPSSIIESSRERFRQGAVFARPCPHAVAARREEAARLEAHGDHQAAIARLRRVCSDAPEEPAYRLDLADHLAIGDGSEQTEALTIWRAIANSDAVTSSVQARAWSQLIDNAGNHGDVDTALKELNVVEQLPLEDGERRMLTAKNIALTHLGPASSALRQYFFNGATAVNGKPVESTLAAAIWATIVEPSFGFGFYLRGLQYDVRAQWSLAVNDLRVSISLGLPSTLFIRNAARRLAIDAYRAHDDAALAVAIHALSAPTLPMVDRLLAEDWQARRDFDAATAAK